MVLGRVQVLTGTFLGALLAGPIEVARNPTFSGSSSLGHPAASPPFPLKVPRSDSKRKFRGAAAKGAARHGQGMGPGVARPRAAPSARRSGIGLPAAFKSHARRRWRLQQRASTPKAESKPGPRVTFESEVRMTGAGTFIESGRITYGKAGRVTFKTTGHGVLGATGVDDLQRGAVIWGSDRWAWPVRRRHGAHYLQLHSRVEG